jgi:carbon storage regulator
MEGTAMLVLSRKARQRIVIGENIELVVVSVSGDRVKLGFNAPSEVQIHREELHRRIQSENGAAAADCCGIRAPQIGERFLPVSQS